MPRPSVFYALAILAFGLFAIDGYADSQAAADRMLALRKGSPDPVALEHFDAARHQGVTGEVLVRAQVDVSLPLHLRYREALSVHHVLAYPLVALSAQPGQSEPPVLGFFFVSGPQSPGEGIDHESILPNFEGGGAQGPIVLLNGELGTSDRLTNRVAQILTEEGRAVSPNLISVATYPQGRVLALAGPRPSSFGATALVLGLMSIGIGLVLARILPVVEERRRLNDIAQSGRKRSGVSPEPETDKGRSRLAPLSPVTAPSQEKPKPAHGPLTALLVQGWDNLRAWNVENRPFKNQR